MNENSDAALARIMKARSLKSVEDARVLYAKWAQTYDNDVFDTLKVTGSNRVADLLAQHITKPGTTAVLDAGCGTGAVAMRLARHGFNLIDGIDLSPEMLVVADSKGVYRQLTAIDMNDPFELSAGPYAAIVSAGTFTTGHVGRKGFENLLAHLATGGICACAIANEVWIRDEFDARVASEAYEVLFHQLEAVVPGMSADTHMLIARRTRHVGQV